MYFYDLVGLLRVRSSFQDFGLMVFRKGVFQGVWRLGVFLQDQVDREVGFLFSGKAFIFVVLLGIIVNSLFVVEFRSFEVSLYSVGVVLKQYCWLGSWFRVFVFGLWKRKDLWLQERVRGDVSECGRQVGFISCVCWGELLIFLNFCF